MHGSLTRGNLRRRLRVSGSQALALSVVVSNAIRIVSTMLLTRLLSPEVYGITGMILAVFFVINMLSDVGFQAYIVRHERSDEPNFLNAVWTIHASRGLMLTVVGIFLAWPLSVLLAKPEVAAPLAVASFIFAIEGLGSLNQFRGLRQGRVQRFALLDLITAVSQTVVAIVLAYFTRNVWAIIVSMLAGSGIRVCLSYSLYPSDRRRLRADGEVAADLWRFSRMIAASSALTLVITQVDKLAMGRILSLSQFGTYVVASALATAPTVFAYDYASTIVYPSTSAAWREGRPLTEVYYRSWGRFFYLYVLGGGVLIGGSNLLVRLLYDPRYLAAAVYLSILAVGTALIMITRSMDSLLVASGHVRATLELNVVRVIWLLSGSGLALARADAMLFVLTIGLIEIPAYCYAAWRLHRLGFIRWWREASAAMTIAAGIAIGGVASYVGFLLAPNL